jgi:hypothetical protein
MVEPSAEIDTEVPRSAAPEAVSSAIWVQVPDWSVKTNAAPPLLLAPSAPTTTVWPSPEIAADAPKSSPESVLGGVSSALWENPWPLLVKT